MEDFSENLKYQLLKNNNENVKNPKTGLPVKLYRIIALKDFESREGLIRKGEIGGFIQSEKNLSQTDSSWVCQMAKVFDNVQLVDSYVTGDARLFQNAKIERSSISGKVRIYENAQVSDSFITDNVDIYGEAKLKNCIMKNAAVACDKAEVTDTELRGGSRVSGTSKVSKSKLTEVSEVKGSSFVDNCFLSGRTVISNGTLRNENRNEQIELTVIVNNG